MTFGQLNKVQQQLLLFAAKFGYLNKRIFFECSHLKARSYKYRAWTGLLDLQLLSPYKRRIFAQEYFYLNKRGLALLRAKGIDPVGKVNPIYFEHDDTIMQFAMIAESSGLIKLNWINEGVLKKLPATRIHEIFNNSVIKLPDLVFELNLKNPTIKVALEVERSAKNQVRYDSLVIGYSKAKSVDLVLVVHANSFTRQAILVSMRKLGYPKSQRPIAFIDYNDFLINPKTAVLELDGRRISFQEYVQNIQRLSEKTGDKQGDLQSLNLSPRN